MQGMSAGKVKYGDTTPIPNERKARVTERGKTCGMEPVGLHVSIGALRAAVCCNPLDVVKMNSFSHETARYSPMSAPTTHDDRGFREL
jgi:hypothetical protein